MRLFMSFIAAASLHAAEPLPLKAGAAAVDVSPVAFPINMPGGFDANLAEGVNDPLMARAVALSDGRTTLILSVVDNLGLPPELIAEAKRAASAKTGVHFEHMLVASTHTHSGVGVPATAGAQADSPAEKNRAVLVAGLTEALVKAHAALKPASVAFASRPLPHEVFNRRWYLKEGKMQPNPFGKMDKVRMNPPNSPDVLDRPAGPTDPEVSLLSVRDAKGRPLAVFANYSLHYVGATPRGKISADYYGEFARLVPQRLGESGLVAMMSNGTSGDINNSPFGSIRPPREPMEQVRIVAQETADTVWHALRDVKTHETKAVLGLRQRTLTLKYRKPTQEQVLYAKAVLAIKDEAAKQRLPRLAEHYARRTLIAAERKEETVDVILQTFRIGESVVIGIPFETFAEIGLALKKESPFARTMVVGLANGRHGYLPTPSQHELGGYETWLGTCHVQEDASDLIMGELRAMLEELRQL